MIQKRLGTDNFPLLEQQYYPMHSTLVRFLSLFLSVQGQGSQKCLELLLFVLTIRETLSQFIVQ